MTNFSRRRFIQQHQIKSFIGKTVSGHFSGDLSTRRGFAQFVQVKFSILTFYGLTERRNSMNDRLTENRFIESSSVNHRATSLLEPIDLQKVSRDQTNRLSRGVLRQQLKRAEFRTSFLLFSNRLNPNKQFDL